MGETKGFKTRVLKEHLDKRGAAIEALEAEVSRLRTELVEVRREIIDECREVAERIARENLASAEAVAAYKLDDRAEEHRGWAEGATVVARALEELQRGESRPVTNEEREAYRKAMTAPLPVLQGLKFVEGPMEPGWKHGRSLPYPPIRYVKAEGEAIGVDHSNGRDRTVITGRVGAQVLPPVEVPPEPACKCPGGPKVIQTGVRVTDGKSRVAAWCDACGSEVSRPT